MSNDTLFLRSFISASSVYDSCFVHLTSWEVGYYLQAIWGENRERKASLPCCGHKTAELAETKILSQLSREDN